MRAVGRASRNSVQMPPFPRAPSSAAARLALGVAPSPGDASWPPAALGPTSSSPLGVPPLSWPVPLSLLCLNGIIPSISVPQRCLILPPLLESELPPLCLGRCPEPF